MAAVPAAAPVALPVDGAKVSANAPVAAVAAVAAAAAAAGAVALAGWLPSPVGAAAAPPVLPGFQSERP